MVSTPADWFAGQEVLAETMEEEVHDQFADLIASWTTYTPVWSSTGTQPVLGANGSLIGRHKTIGKLCTATFRLTMGAATTYGTGAYAISLPFPAATGVDWVGHGLVGDSSAGSAAYSQATIFVGSGASGMNVYTGNTGGSGQISATVPQTFASGDTVRGTITYEIA